MSAEAAGRRTWRSLLPWTPRPLPLLLGVMAWLAYWSLPVPHKVPGAVMDVWMAVNFAAAAASAGLLGRACRPAGTALIAIVSFIGVTAATNGHLSAAVFLLLTQGLLTAGAVLIRVSRPARLRPVVKDAA